MPRYPQFALQGEWLEHTLKVTCPSCKRMQRVWIGRYVNGVRVYTCPGCNSSIRVEGGKATLWD